MRSGRTYIEVYGSLAQRALSHRVPRFKLRPKFHQLHCELICQVANGSRLNPRYGSTFSEEDMVGNLMRMAKASVSPTTLSLRMLQRWLLHYNGQMVKAGRARRKYLRSERVSRGSGIKASF